MFLRAADPYSVLPGYVETTGLPLEWIDKSNVASRFHLIVAQSSFFPRAPGYTFRFLFQLLPYCFLFVGIQTVHGETGN